jgi:hypothetical protein
MTTQTPPFKNGDTVIFNMDKWAEAYPSHKNQVIPYRVLVTDFNPDDSETFAGTHLDGEDAGTEDVDFLTNYFEKIVD